MKCPKCTYLGFDTGERCRNCGYDFSLIAGDEPAAGLSLRTDADASSPVWLETLDRGLVMPATTSTAVATPPALATAASRAGAASAALELEPTLPPPSFRGEPALPLFSASATDDEPLIKLPSAPRAPLSVRRTPDTPRLRAMPKRVERTAEPQLDFADEQTPPPAGTSDVRVGPVHLETTSPSRRLLAAAIDHAILLVIDVVVLYLTLRIASLTMDDWRALPILPMATFLGLLKLSYFTAFTCVGGQTIGKMAANIRVIGDDDRPLDAAHAVHRALAGAVSFLILGAGFAPALFSADRRALHDRLARTRVVTLPGLLTAARVMRRLGLFIATCGYIGYVPIAPGTFGSAAGLAAFALVRSADSYLVEGLTIVALFLVGVWSGTQAEHHFGGVDPAPIVVDEVVGMLITLAFLPVTWTGALVGFLVFRLLDVYKPWPAARFEGLPGGLGVMADDGMAAVYGNLVMRLLILLAPAGWLV